MTKPRLGAGPSYTRTAEHRQQMSVTLPKGEDHPNWKGESASYNSIHEWVRRHKTRREVCSLCNRKTPMTEWANIDHKYRRVLDDYIEVCKSCHNVMDERGQNFKHEILDAELR